MNSDTRRNRKIKKGDLVIRDPIHYRLDLTGPGLVIKVTRIGTVFRAPHYVFEVLVAGEIIALSSRVCEPVQTQIDP